MVDFGPEIALLFEQAKVGRGARGVGAHGRSSRAVRCCGGARAHAMSCIDSALRVPGLAEPGLVVFSSEVHIFIWYRLEGLVAVAFDVHKAIADYGVDVHAALAIVLNLSPIFVCVQAEALVQPVEESATTFTAADI